MKNKLSFSELTPPRHRGLFAKIRSLRFMLVMLLATLGVNVAFGEDETLTWTLATNTSCSGGTNVTGSAVTPQNGETYSAGTWSFSSSKYQSESKKHQTDSYYEDFSTSTTGADPSNTARLEFPFSVKSGYAFSISSIGIAGFEQGGGGGPALQIYLVQGANKVWVGYKTPGTSISCSLTDVTLSAGDAKLVFILGLNSNLNNNRQFKIKGVSIAGTTKSVTPTVAYTVTFNANGGTCSTASLTEASAGAGVTLPSATPADEATQEFRGWSVSSTEPDPAKIFAAGATYKPTKSETLYAIYGAKTVKSAIVYANTKGATNSNPTQYTEGVGVASFAALEDVTGFHFTGWNPSSISAEATGEQTITAEWEAVVSPYFVMNYSKPSDSKVESIACTNGSIANNNADQAFTFETNDLKFGSNSNRLLVTLDNATIVEGTKIEISWISLYNDGSKTGIGVLNENNANKTMDITGLGGTSKTETGTESYTFTAAAAANYTDKFIITRNGTGKSLGLTGIKVYNVGPAATKYTVTYMDGTTELGTEEVEQGQKAANVPTSAKELYTFAGWEDAEHNPIDFATATITGPVVAFAKWTPWGYAASVDLAAEAAGSKTAIATFLAAANIDSKIDGSGEYDTNGLYTGFKMKKNGDYITFNLQSGKRVKITMGYVQTGVTITIDGVAQSFPTSTTEESVFTYDAASDVVVKLVNNSADTKTTTLKSIEITDAPALSDDITLSSLKYGETAITTAADKFVYNVTLPYGAAVPTVTAVANHANATVGEITQASAENSYYASFWVTAEDGTTKQAYQVRFTWAPKLGVSLIHAQFTGNAAISVVDAKSYIGGTVTSTGSLNGATIYEGMTGYKFQKGDNVALKLAEGSFQTGDVVEVFVTTAQSLPIIVYEDALAETEIVRGAANMVQGVNYVTLTADAEKLYFVRTDDAHGNNGWNPNVAYFAVRRFMAPVITSFKIGDEEGMIDQENKTIAVKVAYDADLAALTAPVVEAIGNGGAAVVTPTAQTDFSAPVVFTATDAYGELSTNYTVTVTKRATPAAVPTITTQPASHDYADTETIAALTVIASTTDAGVLSYQWYKGEEKVGENLPTYTPTEAGSYKVVVTNTLGEETATATSNVAVITVTHYYTFASWDTEAKPAEFAKAGEWTIYSVDGNGIPQATTKFAADQQVDKTDATIKATALVDRRFAVKFDVDAKSINFRAYAGNNNRTLLSVKVSDELPTAKADYKATDFELVDGTLATDRDYNYTVNGHFEAGKYYLIDVNNGSINLYDFFYTESEVASHAVTTITEVKINGEALDATELAEFIANKSITLPKTDAAFDVRATDIVKDIYDDGFEKVLATNETYTTAALEGDNFVATLDINDVTYTVTAPKMADPVAKIGTAAFETLAEAVAAANTGDEIILLADVEENIVVPAGKNIVLNLGGFALNGKQAANTATVKNLGTLTIKNGTVKRMGEGSAVNYYVIENEGTMTLNCNVEGNGQSSLIRNNAATAVLTITDGNYTQTGAFIVVKNDLGEVIINGGTFTTTADKAVLNNWDQMTINGGTFTGLILNGAYDTDNNKLIINDGIFNTDKIRTYTGNGMTSAPIEIYGGEFTSTNMLYTAEGTATASQASVAGGTFKTEVPAEVCAAGFEPKDNGDGTYGVKVMEAILPVNGSTTWRWADIADQAEDVVAQFTDINLATRITATEEFKSQCLKATGTRTVRLESSHYFAQVSNITFETTVPGFVTISMRSTGSGKTVTATIQGTVAGSTTNSFTTLAPVFVNAGEVSIDITGDGLGRIELIEFTAADYTRDVVAGNYSGFCINKAVDANMFAGAEFYTTDYKTGSGSAVTSLTLREVDHLEAGVGYICLATANKIYMATNGESQPAATEGTIIGAYERTLVPENAGMFVVLSNKLYECGTNCHIKAGSAYINMGEVSETPSQAPGRRRVVGSTNATTGLEMFEATDDMQKLLINGQLYIIRGGKMFNAAGLLVK